MEKLITTEHIRNSYILVIDDEDITTAKGTQNTLALLKSKDVSEFIVHSHKRKAFNRMLLNKHRSMFDQYEKIRPVLI